MESAQVPPPSTQTGHETTLDDGVPPLRAGLLLAHAICLLAVVLGMTPLTHNLDDIKILLFFCTGPGLMLYALIGMHQGKFPYPSRWVGGGLLAFAALLFLSTLHAEFRWEGWFQLLVFFSAMGYFLSAFVLGSNRRSAEWFARLLLLLLLLTNFVGLFFFDLTGDPAHKSGLAYLYRLLYSDRPPTITGSHLQSLLYTLYSADGTMQSTILNRDFYAAFCVLYLPLAMLFALDPGPSRRPTVWRALGLTTALFSIICIFFCMSKGEWIFGTVCVVVFGALFYKLGETPGLRPRHLWAWMIGVGLLLICLGWMKSPILLGRLKSLAYSIKSRSIIWDGAVEIFKDYPLLGAGPGNFRIYFPQYRSDDYFQHEISNVTLYAHNYFLDLLAETGLLGLGTFCVFLGALWLGGMRWAFKHPAERTRVLLAAALVGVFGMFGSNLSSPNGRWVIGASSLWTMMGLTAGLACFASTVGKGNSGAAESAAAAGPLRRRSAARWPKWTAATLASICAVVWLISIYEGKRYFESAKHYANGMRLMDPAYQMMNAGTISAQKLNDYLTMASDHFENAARVRPGNISAYYKLGSIYSTLSLLQRDLPEGSSSSQGAGAGSRRADRYLALAKSSYEKLREFAPDYAEVHYNLGIVYHEYAGLLQRIKEGKTAWAPKDARSPDDRMINEYKERALEHLDRMSEMSIKPEMARLRGQQYMQMGLHEKGLEVYREASHRYPDDRDMLENYRYAGAALKDHQALADSMERLWRLSPGDNQTLDDLLRICVDFKVEDVLERVIERFQRVNPIDPRLYLARAHQAKWQDRSDLLLDEVERHVRGGGRDREALDMGIEAATAAERRDLADRWSLLLKPPEQDPPPTNLRRSREKERSPFLPQPGF